MILEGILALTALCSAYSSYKNGETTKTMIMNNINNANNNAEKLHHQQIGPDVITRKTDTWTTQTQNIICSTINSIKNNPVKSIVIATATASCWIYYSLHQCYIMLQDLQSWCNWNANADNNQDFLKILKQRICTKYITTQTTTSNDLTQLFLNDVARELRNLDHYLFWQQKFAQIKIDHGLIFPYTQQLIESKQQYLKFILNIFMLDLAAKQNFL